MIMEVKERINELTDEMLDKVARLVRYDSQLAPAKTGMPFGEGPAMALAEGLKIAGELGFETRNLDNYCGYAEIGEGKDIIGIVGHLDVVPAGEGWSSDPFKMEVRDGYMYGRGVIDDKGPVIASMYAMKLVKEAGVPLNKRIRLIMGCNEETGSLCMKHYNEVAEPVTIGFTPDGGFPGIHGEKGKMDMMVYSKNTKIISMEGGFVSNAVCSRCTTVIPEGEIEISELEKALAKTPLTDFSVKAEGGSVTIYAIGTAAHASNPLLGVNAASYTMKALCDAGFTDDFADFYISHIGTGCDGAGYGLDISDEYGRLSFNNGIVKTENGVIMCDIDIRYPVTFTEEKLRELCAPYLEDEKGRTEITWIGPSLFYPADSDLVRELYESYVEVTKDTEHKPVVIGGGTYAKSIKGIIAFGAEYPGKDYHMHDADERHSIEDFKTTVEIYVNAIRKLLAV